MKAKHDGLILKLINDPHFRIEQNGKIFKRIRAWDKNQRKELWKEIKGTGREDGYLVIRYAGRNLKFHRVVWAKFRGTLKKGLVINHIDADKKNNDVSNLEMITQAENIRHRIKIVGYRRCGKKGKLTWEKAQEVKKDWGSEEFTQAKLAEKYDCSYKTIARIVRGETYTDPKVIRKSDAANE